MRFFWKKLNFSFKYFILRKIFLNSWWYHALVGSPTEGLGGGEYVFLVGEFFFGEIASYVHKLTLVGPIGGANWFK